MSTTLTQHELLIKAQSQFEAIVAAIQRHTQDETRTDVVEREVFGELLALGNSLLSGFITGAGNGDEGPSVNVDGKTLYRSEEPRRRVYHSIFGEIDVVRYVYAPGPKKQIAYSPVDARLGMPRGEYSYVLEDWLERFCVKEPFAEGVSGLAAILQLKPSLRTAEVLNQRMAEHAAHFRNDQDVPEESDDAVILVATADGTSVPMRKGERTSHPRAEAGPQAGTTKRAYVGAVYNIAPFVRTTEDILDELFRKESSVRRPRPEGKRLWAEMSNGRQSTLISGVDYLFVRLALDLYEREQQRKHVLVSLMDGEQKLWELQERWFGRAVQILDFYHVLKRIRTVAKLAETDESQRKMWVENQVRDLLEGRVETVIRRWKRLSTKLGDPDDLTSALTYFRNNRHRMRYDEYLSKGYPIGSGVAEGACRNLVKDRMDRTGMHWTLDGARALLWTRALYLNGDWNDFVEYRIQREQEQLYGIAA